jgi:hypothetical protein
VLPYEWHSRAEATTVRIQASMQACVLPTRLKRILVRKSERLLLVQVRTCEVQTSVLLEFECLNPSG